MRGVGLRGALEATGGTLDVGNSGTLLRLLPGWLAGQPGGVWTLDGDESIRKRPVDRVVEPLARMGATVEARDGRLPPLHGAAAAQLTGIEYELPVASAQVKSCVLIAGLLAEGETVVREPHPSRDHTERILLGSRARFARRGRRIAVRVAARRARAGRGDGAGRPVVGGVLDRGGDARAGFAHRDRRGRPQLDAHGLHPDRRADGRGGRGRPGGAGHLRARGADRRPRRGVVAARGHRGGGRRRCRSRSTRSRWSR